jgi:acyl-CoA hydrolase
VNVIITEHGVADLRGKSPIQRAEEIINNCVAPEYKQVLRDYMKMTDEGSHTPHDLAACFGMHEQFLKTGSMLGTDWTEFHKN